MDKKEVETKHWTFWAGKRVQTEIIEEMFQILNKDLLKLGFLLQTYDDLKNKNSESK